MEKFVKAVEGSGFAFLQEMIPRIIMENLKACIFDGPQVKEPMKVTVFNEALSKLNCLSDNHWSQ